MIVEDESVGKKRMIHDATHGVRVNHRIRCRDKIRAPGPREKKQVLREKLDRLHSLWSDPPAVQTPGRGTWLSGLPDRR